jgi:hypothetical protein
MVSIGDQHHPRNLKAPKGLKTLEVDIIPSNHCARVINYNTQPKYGGKNSLKFSS